jgi:hypothetical protein
MSTPINKFLTLPPEMFCKIAEYSDGNEQKDGKLTNNPVLTLNLISKGVDDYFKGFTDLDYFKVPFQVCVLVDSTASMQSVIDSVKGIMGKFMQMPMSRSVFISFAEYKDYKDPYTFRATPFTRNIERLEEFMLGLEASGGGDIPECLEYALSRVSNLAWRDMATKVVVPISDAPPHGVGGLSDDFPNPPVDILAMAHRFKEKNIRLLPVFCNSSVGDFSGDNAAAYTMAAMAEITNGAAFKFDHSNLDFAEGLVKAIREEQQIDKYITDAYAILRKKKARAFLEKDGATVSKEDVDRHLKDPKSLSQIQPSSKEILSHVTQCFDMTVTYPGERIVLSEENKGIIACETLEEARTQGFINQPTGSNTSTVVLNSEGIVELHSHVAPLPLLAPLPLSTTNSSSTMGAAHLAMGADDSDDSDDLDSESAPTVELPRLTSSSSDMEATDLFADGSGSGSTPLVASPFSTSGSSIEGINEEYSSMIPVFGGLRRMSSIGMEDNVRSSGLPGPMVPTMRLSTLPSRSTMRLSSLPQGRMHMLRAISNTGERGSHCCTLPTDSAVGRLLSVPVSTSSSRPVDPAASKHRVLFSKREEADLRLVIERRASSLGLYLGDSSNATTLGDNVSGGGSSGAAADKKASGDDGEGGRGHVSKRGKK